MYSKMVFKKFLCGNGMVKKVVMGLALCCLSVPSFASAEPLVEGVSVAVGNERGIEYSYVSCEHLPKTLHALSLAYGKNKALVLNDRSMVADLFAKKIADKKDVVMLFNHPEAKKSFVVDVAFPSVKELAAKDTKVPLAKVTIYGT